MASKTIVFGETLPFQDGVPTLYLAISTDTSTSLDVCAHLDTGAEYSIFSGAIGLELGLDITTVRRVRQRTLLGAWIDTYEHEVRVDILNLEANPICFVSRICFPEQDLPRNLLGRTFQEHLLVGLDVSRGELYLAPS